MPRTSLFHVGNGDMTLVRLPGGRTLLIDINVRGVADGPSDPTPDVARQLRERLSRGPDGRPYVDAMLLSHPDQDHCRGLVKHFHLGPPSALEASDDKILIRELWSSPNVFRRADRKRARENGSLCEDAMAWGEEARRRVRLLRSGAAPADGDRISILGEDEERRRAPPEAILVRPGEVIRTPTGESVAGFSARLLAPLPIGADEDEERLLTETVLGLERTQHRALYRDIPTMRCEPGCSSYYDPAPLSRRDVARHSSPSGVLFATRCGAKLDAGTPSPSWHQHAE